MFQKAILFLREAYAELKKVSWSSKKEVTASTIVVIVLVVVVALFVGMIDSTLSRLLGMML